MNQQNLILARNFLLKWFIVSFILFLAISISYVFAKDYGAEMMFRLYRIEPLYYYKTAFILFGLVKFFLLFFVLSPAIALHWLIKAQKGE
ncbi:MAG: hypothetical protein A2Y25_05480 [Candidatus Melainabacteria bacterium GWF2_37_15]|nr:MAG: hypothetical protein A2Y25_05480 [Candidatus Melainabacteria bacterium GWF2_37_15]